MDRTDRDRKRAEALRANLLRRKAQARGRAHAQADVPDAASRPGGVAEPEDSERGGPARPA